MNTIVTDGQLGQLAVKQNELFGRAKKGVYVSFEEVLDALQQVIEGKVPVIPTLVAMIPGIFLFTVDYSQSLERMITSGLYDWQNDNITAKRFPINGEGIVKYEARYFSFNHSISSENAVREIESADTTNPWLSAKIEHVLSHGKTFPEEQRKFPIIGLGSVAKIDDDRIVPCLGEGGSGRSLDLDWWVYGWDPNYRFLAVRKVLVS